MPNESYFSAHSNSLTWMSGQTTVRSVASYERELNDRMFIEARLRERLAAGTARRLKQETIIQDLKTLNSEADHRLLNGLQLIWSLVSMQGRASTDEGVRAQLDTAAERITMLARVHHRLNSLDACTSIAIDTYFEDLCRDFTSMLDFNEGRVALIDVQVPPLVIDAMKAAPLGYILVELLTNAATCGGGRIDVRLQGATRRAYALSVTNSSSPKTTISDLAENHGLDMKIIGAFIRQIDGELTVTPSADGAGITFTVLFS